MAYDEANLGMFQSEIITLANATPAGPQPPMNLIDPVLLCADGRPEIHRTRRPSRIQHNAGLCAILSHFCEHYPRC